MGGFSLYKELKKEKQNKINNKTTLQYHLTRLTGLIYYSSRREGIRITLKSECHLNSTQKGSTNKVQTKISAFCWAWHASYYT